MRSYTVCIGALVCFMGTNATRSVPDWCTLFKAIHVFNKYMLLSRKKGGRITISLDWSWRSGLQGVTFFPRVIVINPESCATCLMSVPLGLVPAPIPCRPGLQKPGMWIRCSIRDTQALPRMVDFPSTETLAVHLP